MGLGLLGFQVNHLGAKEENHLAGDCLETKSSNIRQRPDQHKPHCSILLRCRSLVCQLEWGLHSHTFQEKSRHCSPDTICPTAPPVVSPCLLAIAARKPVVSGYREVRAASSSAPKVISVIEGRPSFRDRSRSMGTSNSGGR